MQHGAGLVRTFGTATRHPPLLPEPGPPVIPFRSLAWLGALALLPAGLAAQAPLPLKYSGPPTTAAITAGDLMTRLYLFADVFAIVVVIGALGAAYRAR